MGKENLNVVLSVERGGKGILTKLQEADGGATERKVRGWCMCEGVFICDKLVFYLSDFIFL